MTRVNRFLLPLGGFALLVILLAIGLKQAPEKGIIQSPLVGKPAPAFELPLLDKPDGRFASREMAGKVWLLNVWASWCVSCREEHPVLVELSKTNVVPIIGLNYKDQRKEALGWLQQFGDPYVLSITDTDGRVGINYGVYGVPETFVIDKSGVIRYKQIGPVTPDALKNKILPLVAKLQQ